MSMALNLLPATTKEYPQAKSWQFYYYNQMQEFRSHK